MWIVPADEQTAIDYTPVKLVEIFLRCGSEEGGYGLL